MAASGVLKECALSSADWRICCETPRRSWTSLSKSRATLESWGTRLRWLEAEPPLRDLAGDLAEAAQAQSDADGNQQGDHRQHEVDRCGHADLAGFPVGATDRRVEELGGGVGRRQNPASGGGPDRNDRGQQLEGAVWLFVADLVGGIPHADVGKALQYPAVAELVESGRDLVSTDLRRRRHKIESPGDARRIVLCGGLKH